MLEHGDAFALAALVWAAVLAILVAIVLIRRRESDEVHL